jgi:hypothetical protein
VSEKNRIKLPSDDFRRRRALLAPHLFADPGTGGDLPPTDLVSREAWKGIIDLPTDVLLRATSHEGSAVDQLHSVCAAWIFTTPMEETEAPYVFEPALLAHEEFDALAFIALHGYYRQALGCLRNALEQMTVGAGLAVRQDATLFARWRNGEEVKFGNARDWIAASADGQQLDSLAAPATIFSQDGSDPWLTRLYKRLCGYAHSRAGTNNIDFWESNGPVHVWGVLDRMIAETREAMALCMVLLRLGWPGFTMSDEGRNMISHIDPPWSDVATAVQTFLLS